MVPETFVVILGLALASVATAQPPPHHQIHGFVPPKQYGKLHLENPDMPKVYPVEVEEETYSLARQYYPKEDDTCFPPILEPWRCLEDPSAHGVAQFNSRVQSWLGEECPQINTTWCTKPESDFYPMPCNCHAYFRCVQLTATGPLLPCIYWCNPCDLVFDPNTKVCVFEPEAPPGTCFSTPTKPPTTPEPTTPEPTTPEPTTPEPTTTSTSTTTTTPITTPTSTTTPTTTPTTPPPYPCTYDGENIPYPGNCHWYYRCRLEGDGFEVDLFDCGDWVFDPHQGTCTWPEHGDDLCP
jgi:hypothetical protein